MRRTTARPLADRVRNATTSASDVASVARAVFAATKTDVPYAFACLATTDPTSTLITGTFKSSSLPLGDQEFAAAEYGDPDVNQFVDVAARTPPVAVLSVDTDGHPERCRRLRDYMTPQFGFVDEIRLVCRAGGTTWALLGLYRTAGEPFFTAEEGRTLAAANESVADAVRRALFVGTSHTGPARVPVVLVVDHADNVTASSRAAEQLIDDLGGWDHGALPGSVLAVAASARTTDGMAATRIRGRSGQWLTVQGLPLAGPSLRRSVVLTFASAAASEVGAMTIAARGLTAREQDVVGLVLQGASTKAIAAALHLSAHTVQDHLKAVFAKLEVNSRRDLVARLGVS